MAYTTIKPNSKKTRVYEVDNRALSTKRVLPFVFGGFPGFAIKAIYAQSNALFRTV